MHLMSHRLCADMVSYGYILNLIHITCMMTELTVKGTIPLPGIFIPIPLSPRVDFASTVLVVATPQVLTRKVIHGIVMNVVSYIIMCSIHGNLYRQSS